MKKTFTSLIIIFAFLFLLNCSYKYINPKLSDFSDATELIGKNVIYSFEQLQEEEMNLRIEEVAKKESIKPSDLEPKILTFKNLEIRKELIKYIVSYTNLLASIFETDYRKIITDNTKIVNENLDSINENHDDFLTENELGMMKTISLALPEALTFAKKRVYVMKIMKDMQPVLEKVVEKLKGEMESTKVMINNFYSRQFKLMVEDKWPNKESQRVKYSKIGVKILIKKNKINIILTDLIKAIDIIPETHKELRGAIKNHNNPVYALKELINYAYRIKESYEDFSK